jgi:radical SAM protein with 4Fe4S-binding SPASM domain
MVMLLHVRMLVQLQIILQVSLIYLGHVSDLENVKLNTATHWSDRKECPKCPVIHICKGACFFLSGESMGSLM